MRIIIIIIMIINIIAITIHIIAITINRIAIITINRIAITIHRIAITSKSKSKHNIILGCKRRCGGTAEAQGYLDICICICN